MKKYMIMKLEKYFDLEVEGAFFSKMIKLKSYQGKY